MKQTHLLGAVCLLCTIIYLSSCGKETTFDQDAEVSKKTFPTVEEKLAATLAEAEQKPYLVVEHCSFDYLNNLLITNGLPGLDSSRYNSNPSARDYPCTYSYTCAAWVIHGDWNGNDTLSALDLYLANQYLCNSVGCSGNLATDGGGVSDEAIEFGFISVLCDGGEAWILNQEDIASAQDYVLGHPVCY